MTVRGFIQYSMFTEVKIFVLCTFINELTPFAPQHGYNRNKLFFSFLFFFFHRDLHQIMNESLVSSELPEMLLLLLYFAKNFKLFNLL